MRALLGSFPSLPLLLVFVLASPLAESQGSGKKPSSFTPLFKEGEEVDVYVYTSMSQYLAHGDGAIFNKELNPDQPIFHNTSSFGWQISKGPFTINVTVPEAVKRNQSLFYAHVFFCKKGISPNPFDPNNQQDRQYNMKVLWRVIPLSRWIPEIYEPAKYNLLFGLPPPPPNKTEEKKVLPYWSPRLAIFVVTDTNSYPSMSEEYISPFLLYSLQQTEGIDNRRKQYAPLLHIDELGTLSKDLLKINDTVTQLPLSISLQPLGITRFVWMLKMEHSVQMHKEIGTPEKEMEEVRRMFVETNSWLLVTTIVVSFLHLLFDILAFKNDINFWRGLQSTKGISVRSIAVSSIMELVVFLYLLDNDTSYLVLFTVGGGLLVNVWKLIKAWSLMRGRGSDKEAEDLRAEQAISRHIDYIASAYLLNILGPPIVGYAVYSLVYEDQRGWYSWALQSGVNVVYAVGFMMMTPQLFLNYKYKSVEHLPWRALIYRALNTFIDDLFAFVITMPGLHRMSVFRDDIVFFIYLYQRWIYRKRRPASETSMHEL